ncbi:MAG: hypothetical protein KatS3mg081_2421 [Gemmatimonadales bacterium]|nr:MAG: hypothetical protein KatS3mg081_2421 [Gemmatimonadales bacterium]
MSAAARRLTSLFAAAAATFGVAALSRVPYPPARPEHAAIRLAWRAPGQRIEQCRRATEEELERLPVHMRREEICEQHIFPYRLELLLDDSLVLARTIRAAGAHRDRPLYVYEEIELDPGRYKVTVRFSREMPEGALRGRIEGDFPEELRLEQEADLGPRAVALVTYDPETRRLVLAGNTGQ